MRRDVLIGVLAVVALLAVSLLGHRESAPPAPTRDSNDFGSGGYRAWYALLEREGVRVQRFREHHDQLARSNVRTLIVAFPQPPVPSTWDAAERDALRAWVRRGGRIVDVGLTPSVDKNDAKGELVFLRPARGRTGALRGAWTPFVRALGERGSMRLAPVKGAHVETLIGDAAGALVVRYREGRGEVLGVADAAVFENGAIARGDDARLAVLAATVGSGTVAFDEAIRGDIVEKPWYRALTAPELVALGIAALAGVLWLAYGIVPLGPAVSLRVPREPTSAEFLDALAALHERAALREHARDALARDARRALERAPRTPRNAELEGRVAVAAASAVASDAELVAFAQVARAARENERTMTDGRTSSGRVRRSTRGGARR